MPNPPEPQPISLGIERLLRSLRAGDRQVTVTVFSRWKELVGEGVAIHVRPLKLDEGTLIVEVDDPAWATQMKFLEADLLGRLRQTGDMSVQRLEVRVRRRRRPG
jgi:predicted nucleic acid-binding Zn ribbon protein